MPPPIPLFAEGCMNRSGSQAGFASSFSKDGSRRSSSSERERVEDLAFCTASMNRLKSGQSRIHCSWFASVFIREGQLKRAWNGDQKAPLPSTVDQVPILLASEQHVVARSLRPAMGVGIPATTVKCPLLHSAGRSARRGWWLSMPFQGLSGATIRPVGARVTTLAKFPY